MKISTAVFSAVMLCALLTGFGAASAQDISLEGKSDKKAIEYRNAMMAVYAWNMDSMKAMVNGDAKFNAKEFAKHARELEHATRLDLLEGFPADSTDGFTGALPEIWTDWAGFERKYQTMQERAAALVAAVESRDKDAAREAFNEVGRACGGCHDRFKD